MSNKEYELTIESESDDSTATIMYNLPFEQVANCDEPIYLGVYGDDRARSIDLTLEQAEEIARGLFHMVKEVRQLQSKLIPKEERDLHIAFIKQLEEERYRKINMFHALTFSGLMHKMEGLEEQGSYLTDKAFEEMLDVVAIDENIDAIMLEIDYDYKVKVVVEEA